MKEYGWWHQFPEILYVGICKNKEIRGSFNCKRWALYSQKEESKSPSVCSWSEKRPFLSNRLSVIQGRVFVRKNWPKWWNQGLLQPWLTYRALIGWRERRILLGVLYIVYSRDKLFQQDRKTKYNNKLKHTLRNTPRSSLLETSYWSTKKIMDASLTCVCIIAARLYPYRIFGNKK